jgi:hypothetical protein
MFGIPWGMSDSDIENYAAAAAAAAAAATTTTTTTGTDCHHL